MNTKLLDNITSHLGVDLGFGAEGPVLSDLAAWCCDLGAVPSLSESQV